jgi:5-oxoprolinase (ATP-hydrolysing) subunit A
MTGRIDLNCDLGERPDLIADGTEEALMESVSSANVACGAHAGDEATLEATIRAALRHRLAIGAHPGFPDREGFGRRELPFSPEEIAGTVRDQIVALLRIARRCGASIGHVKPHGALYNLAARDTAVARAIADGVGRTVLGGREEVGRQGLGRRVTLVGLAGSSMIGAFAEAGFGVAAEAFADRRYEPDGSLRPRRYDDALITDPSEAAAQAIGIVRDGCVTATSGVRVPIRAETLSIHADTPGAPAIARAVAARLREAGIEVRPVSASGRCR